MLFVALGKYSITQNVFERGTPQVALIKIILVGTKPVNTII